MKENVLLRHSIFLVGYSLFVPFNFKGYVWSFTTEDAYAF